MASIVDLREAIESALRAKLPSVVMVKDVRGDLDLDRDSLRAPAVAIAVTGVHETGSVGDQPYVEWEFMALVLAEDLPVDPLATSTQGRGPGGRDDYAMLTLSVVLKTITDNDFGEVAHGVPHDVRALRVRGTEYDELGAAVWAVRWWQRQFIADDPTIVLNDFLRLHTYVDLVDEQDATRSEQATGTITCDWDIAVDGSQVPIAGTTLVARTAPSSALEFGLGTSDAQLATNLAAKINATAALAALVTATALGAVVTLVAKTAGAAGNGITLGTMGVGFARSGATLTGGVDYPMETQVNLEGAS